MGDDEDDRTLKPRKMCQDDEFMQCPHSGAFIRNPLKEKAKSQPVLLTLREFEHNCVNEAVPEWQMLSVGESDFREMMSHFADTHGKSMPSLWSRSAALQSRCSIGKVHTLTGGFDFIVQVKKSMYVVPRKKAPRPGDRKFGDTIDKLNIEVSKHDEYSLRVENINEGLILQWNRNHPEFPVKIGDIITRVNDRRRNARSMIEELQQSPDLVRITVHREKMQRMGSKDPRASMNPAAEGTMLPASGAYGDFSAASLAKPEGAQRRRPSLTDKFTRQTSGQSGH